MIIAFSVNPPCVPSHNCSTIQINIDKLFLQHIYEIMNTPPEGTLVVKPYLTYRASCSTMEWSVFPSALILKNLDCAKHLNISSLDLDCC